MSEESGRPSSRFRSGRVTAPATPVARLEALLDDGEALLELFQELVATAVRGKRFDQVVELAAVAARAEDPHRAYAAQRIAAELLVAGSAAAAHDERHAWAAYHDTVIALLVPVLEEQPHEPELLNLLGLAVYELGHPSLARRMFETIRTIEPSHAQARANLRACRERMGRGAGVAAVPDHLAPVQARMRTRVKRIADQAAQLPERTISLCMIVRDEEEMLPGCLEAVAGHVDQIVVVDTGSTDRTREIAREHGAEVVEFAWTGSFSDARNESLRHATGDWVLYLDADEHMVAEDAPQLRELVRRTWVEAFYLVETHFTGEAEIGGQSTHAPMRLFRRRPHYHWQGRVHEQLLHAFPTWLPERFQNTGVRVDHYGYLNTVIDDRSKHDRNLSLLKEQLAERRDAFTCFNIGSEYGAMQDWQQARPWFEEALEHARTEVGWHEQQFAPLMVQRTITARRGSGDPTGALELVEEALGWWPAYTDLVFERALVHLAAREWDQAADQARRALAMGDAPARYVAGRGKGSYQARAVLAAALQATGDDAGACEQLETAMVEAPHFIGSAMELADLLIRTRGATEASRRMDELLGDRAELTCANMQLAAAFHDAGATEEAEARYQRILAAHPGHGMAHVGLAELRLAQGRPADALAEALRVANDDRMAAAAARTSFLAAVVLEDAALLAEPAARVAQATELPTAERAVYVAWQARITGSNDLTVLVPPEPAAVAAVLANLEALAKLEATDEFEQLFPLVELVLPDERERRMELARLYLRRRFADMAGEELLLCAERFGPDAEILTGLGKVATIKHLWEDAEVFLSESLKLDPRQEEARALLNAVQERMVG